MTEVEGPRGTYRPCPTCAAPVVDPFPHAWTLELIKEGPADGYVSSYVTPHRDTCDAPPADPQPGIAVRMPGHTVTSVGFEFGRPPFRDDLRTSRVEVGPGLLFAAPAGAVWPDDGWVTLGYTDGGMVSRDGITWELPGERPDLSEPDLSEPDLSEPAREVFKGVTVSMEATLADDQIALISGLNPGDRLPGESIIDALVRLGRIAVTRVDPPDGEP